jgi:hypothetical protein
MSNFYYADNILSLDEVKYCYNVLLNHKWNIKSFYQQEGIDNSDLAYPNMMAYKDGTVYDPYLFGLMSGILFSVNKRIQEKYNFTLPTHKIKTVQFNAQGKSDDCSFHSDGTHNQWSVVGFLTPQWHKEWGGDLQIEDETVTYKPGDFVVFKSSHLHDALPVKVKTPFWRITTAIFLDAL